MQPRLVLADKKINYQCIPNCMQALGYLASTGICSGFNGAVLPGLFLRDWQTTNLRIRWMDLIHDYSAKTGMTVKSILTQIADRAIDVPAAALPIIQEIPAFCEAIELHFEPEHYADWFEPGKQPAQYNLLSTLPIMTPKALEEKLEKINGKPCFTFSLAKVGAFRSDELAAFFICIREAMEILNIPLAMQLSTNTHTQLVCYDLESKSWIVADSLLPLLEEAFSEVEIAESVTANFTDFDEVVFSWEFIGLTRQNVMNLQLTLENNALWKMITRLDQSKMDILGNRGESLVHLAANVGDEAAFLKCVALQPTEILRSVKTLGCPLELAAEGGQVLIIKYILEQTFDLAQRNAALLMAIHTRQLGAVTCLLQYGASPDARDETGSALEIAFDKIVEIKHSQANHAIIFELLYFGATVTDACLVKVASNDTRVLNIFRHFKHLQEKYFCENNFPEYQLALMKLRELALENNPANYALTHHHSALGMLGLFSPSGLLPSLSPNSSHKRPTL